MRATAIAFGVFLFAFTTLGHAADAGGSKTIDIYSEAAKRPFNPVGGVEPENSQCGIGGETYLECNHLRATVPQHDVDFGRTELVLRSKDGKTLTSVKLADVWENLSFNRRTGKYLLGHKSESGVKVGLRDLVYLDEKTHAFQDSVFAREGYSAQAAIVGPDGRYLVFVGFIKGESNAHLYAMDLEKDTIRDLGEPPLPPPFDAEMQKDPSTVDKSWAWSAPERWYTDLEPSILRFSDAHTVEASYGKDTFRGRSAKRTTKAWDLTKE